MLIPKHVVRQNPASICPPEIYKNIVGLLVSTWTLEATASSGIIEIHRDAAADVQSLFDLMFAIRFPVACIRPVADYGWSDALSMRNNNTSGFNYRTYISKSDGKERRSRHAFGCAIDINPWFNPDVFGETNDPEGAVYDPLRPGTLTAGSPVVLFMKRRGWIWGGDWETHQDYQHFERPD